MRKYPSGIHILIGREYKVRQPSLKVHNVLKNMGGPLTYDEIQGAGGTEGIANFVETGTYKGDTTLMAAKHFEHVFTTEIHKGLYEESKERAKKEGVENIEFYLGDSVELLHDICPKVKDGAVFFIDAHISGSDSGWNGKQRVPLMDELKVILSYNVGPSVFIIDDLRLWKNEVWDWAHVTDMGIVKLFVDSGYNIASFYEKNDRFFVVTK